MRDNEIIGVGWVETTEVLKSAELAYATALKMARVDESEIQALGTTGYGRLLIGEEMKAALVQEELTVNSKGAVYLAETERACDGIDIGGMDTRLFRS